MSTVVTLQDVKNIDERTKDIVFGYIRRLQLLLSRDNVPSLVSHWCLLYYYQREFFRKHPDVDNLSINESKNIAKVIAAYRGRQRVQGSMIDLSVIYL